MRIWLINHYAVPPQYYPLARQTCFAKHLMAMGHEVKIIAASSVHNSDLNLITDGKAWREETVDGVDYVYIRCCDYADNGLKRVYNMCEFAWKLPGVCRHLEKPDAIVATSMPPMSCAMGVHLGRKYKCRTVAEIADLWPESIVAYGIAGPKNPAVVLLRRLEKWIYKKADAVVFTVEGAYDYIHEQRWEKAVPRDKVFYINNGVDLDLFRENLARYPADDPDLSDPDSFKVVYAGSIRRANAIGVLLDAAEKLRDLPVKFLLWGDGDEREELEKRARETGLDKVVFKGRVEKKFVPGITAKADLNYLDLFQDNIARFGISPNKLFDYAAAGKPILMPYSGPYDPMKPYGCALVCAPDADSIAEGIRKVYAMSADERAAMAAGAEKAAEQFDFKNLSRMLAEIIEGIRK